jgi:hypothetical protein
VETGSVGKDDRDAAGTSPKMARRVDLKVNAHVHKRHEVLQRRPVEKLTGFQESMTSSSARVRRVSTTLLRAVRTATTSSETTLLGESRTTAMASRVRMETI